MEKKDQLTEIASSLQMCKKVEVIHHYLVFCFYYIIFYNVYILRNVFLW